MVFLPSPPISAPRASQVPTDTPDMHARAGARGQPCSCSSQPVRGRLGAASVDTPLAGWRVHRVASEQRHPCLPAGDKMGGGGGTAPLASLPQCCLFARGP